MCVKIVTDSTCDLPKTVTDELDITVLPCHIHFGDQTYLDGVDITNKTFYARLDHSSPYPTSAAPSLGSFANAYKTLIENGASSILSIHISSKLASTYNTAVLAAESAAKAIVKPFDSGQLSLGTGLLVEAAARAANAGETLESIIHMITELSRQTYACATADTLKYLRRSGRISQIVAGVGSILQIRPIVNIHLGRVGLELARTSRQSLERLASIVHGLAPLEKLAIVHTHAAEKAAELAEQVKQYAPDRGIEYTADVSPAIGVHFGPGAVGFVAIQRKLAKSG